MKTIFLFLSIVSILLCSCDNHKTKVDNNFIIKIQPFRGTNPGEVKEVADLIKKYYPHVTVATTLDLPEFAFYKPRGRYKADSLLKFLSASAKKNEILLGITKTDISTKKGVIPDWGVMGLGKCPGNSCVASSFRLNMANGKKQLFKVCIHELGHTMGLPHCPNLECYMRDANEGNPLDEENGFCSRCKRYLQSRNWKVL